MKTTIGKPGIKCLVHILATAFFLLPPLISVVAQDENEPINCDDLTLSTDFTHISCYGYNNGSIEISVSGGTDPYQFSINDGESYSALNIYDSLNKGIYNISVIDANNCEKNDEIEITEPDNEVINLGSDLEIESNYTLTFDAGAGYNEYNWSTGESGQTITFSKEVDSTSTEIIFVEVIDNNGCQLKSTSVKVSIRPSERADSEDDIIEPEPIEESELIEDPE